MPRRKLSRDRRELAQGEHHVAVGYTHSGAPAALHSPCAAAARAACSRPLRGSSRLLFTSLDTTVATSGATLPQSTEPSESRAKSSSRSSRGPSSPLLPAARGDGAKATSMAARCSATCVTFRRSTVRARQAGWMSCFLESSPNFAALMATTVKRSTSRSEQAAGQRPPEHVHLYAPAPEAGAAVGLGPTWTVNVSSSGYELVTRKEVSFPRSILANTRACSTSSPSVILRAASKCARAHLKRLEEREAIEARHGDVAVKHVADVGAGDVRRLHGAAEGAVLLWHRHAHLPAQRKIHSRVQACRATPRPSDMSAKDPRLARTRGSQRHAGEQGRKTAAEDQRRRTGHVADEGVAAGAAARRRVGDALALQDAQQVARRREGGPLRQHLRVLARRGARQVDDGVRLAQRRRRWRRGRR
eukprot:scaffold5178_cov364-Prasinococcus_capsulatus_cf.AAC.19